MPTGMSYVGIVIFAATYVLISARDLRWLGFDRPAGALLGAVACVVFGVLAPDAALTAIDGRTIMLLFGVMGMGAFLAKDHLFDRLERRLVHVARTPQRLLGWIVWGAGGFSAFITNDAMCVLGTPLVVRIVVAQRLPPLPFLLALATAANTGSVATLVGNPQNMLCGSLGGLAYREHLLVMAPVAVVGLAVNHALLRWMFRASLRAARLEPGERAEPLTARIRWGLAIIAATAVAYTLGGDLAWTSVCGLVAMMLFHRRDMRTLWPQIDWSLLLFFAGLFIVVEGFVQSGAPAWLFERFPLDRGHDLAGWFRLSSIFLFGSNIVSNVPFILVVREAMDTLEDPRMAWELLAMASTFAGNLTLLGSVANVIVAEGSREVGGIGFWAYLRVGFPLAMITTASGTVWLFAVLGG